eukprot:scpid97744/ scgid19150/ 
MEMDAADIAVVRQGNEFPRNTGQPLLPQLGVFRNPPERHTTTNIRSVSTSDFLQRRSTRTVLHVHLAPMHLLFTREQTSFAPVFLIRTPKDSTVGVRRHFRRGGTGSGKQTFAKITSSIFASRCYARTSSSRMCHWYTLPDCVIEKVRGE